MPVFLHLEGDGMKKKRWVLSVLLLHDDSYNRLMEDVYGELYFESKQQKGKRHFMLKEGQIRRRVILLGECLTAWH